VTHLPRAAPDEFESDMLELLSLLCDERCPGLVFVGATWIGLNCEPTCEMLHACAKLVRASWHMVCWDVGM